MEIKLKNKTFPFVLIYIEKRGIFFLCNKFMYNTKIDYTII